MKTSLLQIFETTVLQEFLFLEKDFGFELTKESDYQFIAKSRNCHVVIDFDRNVIGCWIEKLDIPRNHPDRGKAVEWIANCFGFQDDELRFLADEESIIRQIKLQAKLLKTYCEPFLLADFTEWKHVNEYIKAQTKIEKQIHNAQSMDRLISEIRQEADAAWLARDYGKVIELFETMGEFLMPSERKKLEYSKNHVLAE